MAVALNSSIGRVCVFGHRGQLGQSLIQVAQENNISVTGFGREDVDITDIGAVERAIDRVQPDILINTAAFHVIAACEKSPEEAFLHNAVAVGKMAALCQKSSLRFVTYSTDYVFDGKQNSPYKEDECPRPLQIYGISKLSGELAALNNHPAGAYVIRTNGVYGGQGSRNKGGNFVLNLLREAKTKREIEVAKNQFANPTYAPDLAKATLELMASTASPGIYHLANEGICSWADFASEAIRYAKIDARIVGIDRNNDSDGFWRPQFTVLANTRAKKFGVELRSWRDALNSYIEELNSV